MDSRLRVGCDAVVDPCPTALARDEPRLSQNPQVVRDRGLVERERIGEVADADLTGSSGQGREHREPIGIGDRLQERGGRREVVSGDRGRRAASLH